MKLILYKGIILLTSISILSCAKINPEIITLKGEKDLIPEGIAVHNDKIFISSILKNKIIQYDISSHQVSDFISPNENGFKLGLGLFTKDNLLFALSNDINTPSLYIFNIEQKSLNKVYKLTDDRTHLWNDMTIDNLNQVYISDTKQNKIYKITYPNDAIEEYFSDSTITSPNGMALSENYDKLFIASDQYGIRILDIKSKKIINKVSVETKGIDGLKYYNGKLYAVKNGEISHKNHGLYTLALTKNLNEIKNVKPLLVKHKLLNVPTTFDITDHYIYLLGNSQMDNLNQESMKIINKSELTDTYVLKIKVP